MSVEIVPEPVADPSVYTQFLAKRSQSSSASSLCPDDLPSFLFDFQAALVEWALRLGRSAIFADCGLGKTPMQLAWADSVVRQTNQSVLIFTPLAVGAQTIREAEKFGIEAVRSRDGRISSGARIYVTNYEQMDKFDSSDFVGVVCDESSCIKDFKSVTKGRVVEFMRGMSFRLLCTATAAPNDYWELGTSSEALGYLGFRDMLTTFFKQITTKDQLGWGRSKYRFRGHAELPFWSWVASWAKCLRKPSDLGFDDNGFVLPPLREHEHVVKASKLRDGMLFQLPAMSLHEQRAERRNSIRERVDHAVNLLGDDQAVVWCELNAEGDELERSIDGAVQVKGSMPDAAKEEILEAFTNGDIKRLVTKPKIGCWGLNWQRCSRVIMFPSHSFERYYQAVRRCWRFGQTRPVDVHLVVSEGERGVLENLKAKMQRADAMFDAIRTNTREDMLTSVDKFGQDEEVPSWL